MHSHTVNYPQHGDMSYTKYVCGKCGLVIHDDELWSRTCTLDGSVPSLHGPITRAIVWRPSDDHAGTLLRDQLQRIENGG